MGDRWDAWALDYNVIFSPYSSPNTKNRSNSQTGIFVHYTRLSHDVATVKVYKVGSGGWTLEDILEATPPSKPMLYRPVTIANCNGTFGNPRITWDNNTEPDMTRNAGSEFPFKRYKIYRAVSGDINSAPLFYGYLATYDDYTPEDTANFIDNHVWDGVLLSCGLVGAPQGDFWRYKITAVDLYNDESVKSDFVSTYGLWASYSEDRPGTGTHSELPKAVCAFTKLPKPLQPNHRYKIRAAKR